MSSVVRVSLGERGYDIQIGAGTLPHCGAFVEQRVPGTGRALIITDSHVGPLYAEVVRRSLSAGKMAVEVLAVAAGEPSKSVATCDHLWNRLLELDTDRSSLLVALGGGVVGDLAGFVAATYARGLAFVQIPTTLLAQVDSSVGGKVGINLPRAKNMVGAFWQPRGVLIDTAVLQSLDARHYRAGLAEVVKYGVILDSAFFAYLEDHVEQLRDRDHEVLAHVIRRCCRLKADVVEADERELTGRRAMLNYGHTFCHAIEAVTGYQQYLHGEAVAIGMLCASRLAESMKRIDSSVTDRQQRLLEALGLPVSLPAVDPEQLLSAMQHDKKSQGGRLRFVLPTKLGHVELVNGISRASVMAVLTK